MTDINRNGVQIKALNCICNINFNHYFTVVCRRLCHNLNDRAENISKFYCRHNELVSKFNVGLKSLLHQGLSETEFYDDLVYKFNKIRGMTDFSDQFRNSEFGIQNCELLYTLKYTSYMYGI